MQFRRAELSTLLTRTKTRCHACDEDTAQVGDGGKGAFLWSHRGELVREEVPLCPLCGAAIGMSVLHRLAIEEEEG